MQGYFSYLPNIDYISRSPDRSSNDEYIPVKNIFRRAKIREDLEQVATSFEDFFVVGDLRPDQLAYTLYGDPRFDWVILVTNNITKVRDQWPLNDIDFRKYCLEKYGSDEGLSQIHHYETIEDTDWAGRIVVPEGLRVDSNFDLKYLKYRPEEQKIVSYSRVTQLNELSTIDSVGTAKDVNGNVIQNQNVAPVTNYEFEVAMNDAKRRIRVLRPIYLSTIVQDMNRIGTYKKSSQFKTKRLKRAFNPRTT
jgi:hypothetical protein|tara:strand:- start:3166 stop:3915 length:750 start_codon:yes stop_codon:yes gene_type:complete